LTFLIGERGDVVVNLMGRPAGFTHFYRRFQSWLSVKGLSWPAVRIPLQPVQ